jgi:uncharacterized protein YndB with AHSA1/START domain
MINESRSFGQIRQHNVNGFTYEISRSLPADKAALWKALTNKEQLALWLANVDKDLCSNGEVKLSFPNLEIRLSACVNICDEEQGIIEYTWQYEHEAPSVVRWEIEDGILRLQHRQLDEHYICKVAAGWHLHLNLLEGVLNGEVKAFRWPLNEWNKLHESYNEQVM